MIYLKLAWRNLWRNKRRTMISLASVFFAVLLAIAMRSMQLGSYDNMVKNVVRFYTGYVQIHKNGYWNEQSLENSFEYSEAMEQQALDAAEVDRFIPRIESFALASKKLSTFGVAVVGIDPEKEKYLTEIDQKIISGEYFDADSKSALLTTGLAEYLDIEPGDTIVLIGQGYHGASAAGKYSVSGIVKFNSPELNKRLFFLPLKEAQWLFSAENRITALIAMTQPDKVDRVVKDLDKTLGDDYEVMSWKELMPEIVQAIEVDNIGGIIVLTILYIVIGFGIFGTILMMTVERSYEFGVLVAMGMKRWKLLTVLSIESILMTFSGVLLGTAVSLPLVIYFHLHPIPLSDELAQLTESYGLEAILPFSVSPYIFLYQALAVLIISLIAMIYPLIKVGRLEVIEAMRT